MILLWFFDIPNLFRLIRNIFESAIQVLSHPCPIQIGSVISVERLVKAVWGHILKSESSKED